MAYRSVGSELVLLLIAVVLVVPLVDQVAKWIVVGLLGDAAIPIGALGQIRAVRGRIWMARMPGAPRRGRIASMWLLWMVAAGAGAAICLSAPSLALPCGLLLGGALSHALETSFRGSICDWVCLRFWPAFNLADVALTAGGLVLAADLLAAIRAAVA